MLLRQRLSDFFHKYLRIPYTLHVHEFQSPKKPKATFVFIHGIGNTLHSWDEVVARLPKDVRLIGIDLLGFGKSPRPAWAVYSAKTQARSVGVTLLKLGLVQQPIVVGHSLGALVAVEVTRRYPLVIRQLVLCSPPFYAPESTKKGIKPPEDVLRELYRIAKKFPSQLERMSPLAVKLGLANKTLNITKDTVVSYMAALEASIINQTSLTDIAKLRVPIDIFYGILDPVVIRKHITELARTHENATAHKLNAGHEVVGSYTRSLSDFLKTLSR
ncbi:MAG: alpha/beta fold hydrolase [Candidatus Microsaccharimonas sp.]